ncbi:MAG: nuclear transport factor 2 family protein [Gemmatimonadetes bacterium]|nr:nuclear transport factor 2 family protein [Gemmatimonadota bacterium]
MDALIRTMVRQASAERAVVELFVAIDQGEWARVRRLFDDELQVELSSVRGAVGTMGADDLVAAWMRGLSSLDAVHHQIGNLRSTIHEDEAHVACHGIAYHYRSNPVGENTRTLVGTYDIGLRDSPRGWHIHTLRFQLRFMAGNPDL